MALKLSMAVPSYAQKRVWVRTITTTTVATTTPSSTTTTTPVSVSSAIRGRATTPSSSLSLNRGHHRRLVTPTIYRNNNNIISLTPSSPCAPSAHDTKPLPFSSSSASFHHKCLSSLSPSSSSSGFSTSSSDFREGFSGSSSSYSSSSSGSESVMGSENKDHGDWSAGEVNGKQSHQQQQHSNKFLTLPTVLTLGRVAAVPLLISTFYVDSWWGTTATTSIFIAAAITDWLDGYIARKMRLGSAFGAFLDPVADKLMVAATLILLCTRPLDIGIFGEVPWLLTVPAIAIIGREITMSAVREWAASQNTKLLEAVAVNNLGKWKTATQMTALTILLATRDSSLGGPGILVASGVTLLYISAGLAVWSLVVYMSKIWRVLLK
ncbi:CDP-diacylglycerol--glycerol-3-phosphate 3-phosphatidyltransferase [Trema orientale]|uniref:CDP-diacylglycerol--glycerol-3-phosphate 1-phosphatidyltransferase n=1 Tax=Trema orientale TaxID=63057 RepID=A0A2P5F165_TREOI|nr:CDP-diacylglycerol--glycerol-3-phosphate 3-phosphatidyltransferase [Trema orientale]